MSFKHFLITESEKKNIKAMYGLITEEVNPAPITTTVTFAGGRYLQQSANFSQVVTNFQKIKDFIKSVPTGKIVEVVIESGESRIPNTDEEKGGVTVGPGYLSQKRYETIYSYLKGQFTKWKQSDAAFKKPEKFTEIPPKIGTTKWVGTTFCPSTKLDLTKDPQGFICTSDSFQPGPNILNWKQGKQSTYKELFNAYQQEQFVKVTFRVANSGVPTSMIPNFGCLSGMKIEFNYDAIVEKSVDGAGGSNSHCCSRGKFTISANGIPLKRTDGKGYANVNNHPDQKDVQELQSDSRPQGQSSIGLRKTDANPNGEVVCLPPGMQGKTVEKDFKLLGLTNYRYNTFKIDAATANKIVRDSGGKPGYLNITVAGIGSVHTQATRLLVYSPDGKIYWDTCSNGVCQRKDTYQIPYCSGKSF